MTLIIYKKKNKIANLFSLLRMLSKLEDNCMHRVTFEAMKEPIAGPHICPNCSWQCTCDNQPCSCCDSDVMIAERDEELKLIMITNG